MVGVVSSETHDDGRYGFDIIYRPENNVATPEPVRGGGDDGNAQSRRDQTHGRLQFAHFACGRRGYARVG